MTRILIIDDDDAVRAATKIVLDSKGFETVAVADGKSGIAAAKKSAFDAVIVDLFMPDMNGLDVAAAIREILPNMPIIAASGFMFGGKCPEMPQFQEMATEAGANAVLYKPFRPKELLQAVQKAIGAAA